MIPTKINEDQAVIVIQWNKKKLVNYQIHLYIIRFVFQASQAPDFA